MLKKIWGWLIEVLTIIFTTMVNLIIQEPLGIIGRLGYYYYGLVNYSPPPTLIVGTYVCGADYNEDNEYVLWGDSEIEFDDGTILKIESINFCVEKIEYDKYISYNGLNVMQQIETNSVYYDYTKTEYYSIRFSILLKGYTIQECDIYSSQIVEDEYLRRGVSSYYLTTSLKYGENKVDLGINIVVDRYDNNITFAFMPVDVLGYNPDLYSACLVLVPDNSV